MLRRTIAIVLFVSGCAAFHNLANPKSSMRQQVDQLDKGRDSYGTVDRATLASGGAVDSESTSVNETRPVLLRGLLNDKLCFGAVHEANAVDSADKTTANAKHLYETARYAYVFYDATSEITDKTPWPAPPDSSAFEVQILRNEFVAGECTEDSQAINGKRCMQDHREIAVGLCGPPPAIPDSAQYLGLALVWPGNDAYRNSIILWKLTGTAPTPEAATPE